MECDIRIKSPTYPMSAEFVIKHMADDTILSLKRKIRDGLCNDQLVESAQKLIYAGHVLEDSKTLAQLQIPGSATFHLVTAPDVRPIAATPSTIDQSSRTSDDDLAARDPAPLTAGTGVACLSPSNEAPALAIDQDITNSIHSSVPNTDTGGTTRSHDNPNVVSEETPSGSVTGGQSPAIVNIDGTYSDAYQLLNQSQNVHRTNIKYDLCYIDGFPYLVQAVDRTRRTSRRARTTTASATTSSALAQGATSATVRQTMNPIGQAAGPATVRHQQVDLPATAAIPVRTADGRRALILSPEGVRAMAAQGINVDTNVTDRNNTFLGIRTSSIRSFMQTGIPHGWLFLKLVFLVAMLGSNSSWYRFILINLVAMGIFLWQSGILRTLLNRNPVPNSETPSGSVQGPAQSTGTVPRSENATGPTLIPTQDAPDARVSPTETTLLHNFGRAFLSSIVPHVSRQTDRPVPAVARPASPAQDPVIAESPINTTEDADSNADGREMNDDDEENRETLVDGGRELESRQNESQDSAQERQALQQQLQDW